VSRARFARRASGVFDILVIVLLVVAVSAWIRGGARGRSAAAPQRAELKVESRLGSDVWRQLWESVHVHGEATAPVRIVEFADFECPACRHFAREWEGVVEASGGAVAMGFAHFPLAQHRFATMAARVAECEARSGRFWSAHDSLFVHQHEFGLVAWDRIVGLEGADGAALRECMDAGADMERIASHRLLGEQLGLRGTPTLIVNGLVLNVPPTRAELDSLIADFTSQSGE